MGGGKAFVDVLDEVLDGYESIASAPRPDARCRVATPSYIPPAHAPWLSAPSGHPGPAASAPRAEAAPPPPPRGPRRTLSMKQQEALDALVALGAEIDPDFTVDELRSVFRTLALRYHPDRHVGSSEREQARLAALFARAHEAYERLKTVPPATMH
jgi:hypothetical protein